MLTSNELGEKGESRFKEICADAKLICNKSDRDLAGWDFIVEFPFRDEPSVSLDSRQSPISCHVQVKTLREKSGRFQMRLSSAERLAKDKKPSFIYIFRVNDKLEFVDSYLIHMLDEPLAVILRRLRSESASSGTQKINKKEITLPVNRNSVLLKPTGSDFRAALEAACGHDTDVYIARKSEQLRTLGFDDGRYKLKASLHLGSDDEMVDAFLGIIKDIPVSNLQAFETRFGIELPERLPGESATLNIIPSPFGFCSITFRGSPLETPVVFTGEMFSASIPGIAPENQKVLIKSDLFSIEFKRGSFRFSSNVAESTKCIPQHWLQYWRAACVMSLGKGIIQIQSNSFKDVIEIPITSALTNPDVDTCKYWVDLCEATVGLLGRAGVSEAPVVTIGELEQNSIHIFLVAEVLNGVNLFKPFFTKIFASVENMGRVASVWADYIIIGDKILVCDGIVQFSIENEENQSKWTAIGFEPKGLRVITKFPEQYEQLIEKAKLDSGAALVMSTTPPKKIRNNRKLMGSASQWFSTNICKQ